LKEISTLKSDYRGADYENPRGVPPLGRIIARLEDEKIGEYRRLPGKVKKVIVTWSTSV